MSQTTLEANPDVMNAAELAQVLRVSASTLRRWAKEQKGPPPLSLPGRLRWSRVEVERFLAGQSTHAAAAR